ncbi:MAG TPA: MmgE/PrpD family protein [Candidatus Acidoferrales bacterium]|nr:MmgE/PrpD family protein [Candidatus Acidoferrales bacterium]
MSDYVAGALDRRLPDRVLIHAKQHVLDTFAAMLSGSQLSPGRAARRYVQEEGGPPRAQVIGSALLTSATLAALANGAAAHADETDDSHAASGTHPGCAVVPAALAVAEKFGLSGKAFLHAVVVGYDIGCRVGRALNPAALSETGHSSRGLANVFGASAAGAALWRLDAGEVACALAYSAQQAAGVGSYIRAEEHFEKALVLGGLPARSGVTAVLLARAGGRGAADPFCGERNFLEAYSPAPHPEELTRGLGELFEVTQTSIKRYCVGSPIQAPLEALLDLMAESRLCAEDVQAVTVRIPERRAATVNDRNMADVNLQLILALALVHGRVSFTAVHSQELREDPSIRSVQARVHLVPDPSLRESASPRQVRLEVLTREGKTLSKHLSTYRGTPENPASGREIEDKARELIVPVIGRERAERLIRQVNQLEELTDVRELRPNLVANEQDASQTTGGEP